MIPDRADVPEAHKWKVEAIYQTDDQFEKEFNQIKGTQFQEFNQFKGTLSSSPDTVKDALTLYFDIDRILDKLYVYAHLRYDEDLSSDRYKNAYIRTQALFHDFQMATSWIEPELLKISEARFKEIYQSEKLSEYRIFLEKIARLRAHTLSEKEEQLLSLSQKALLTSQKAFSAFNNADLKLDKAVDSEGVAHELSQGLYSAYLSKKDRVLRRSAFENLHASFLSHENTLAELLSGQVQNHQYIAKARKYKSSLDAALYPHNIKEAVYLNLIETVKKHKTVIHRYISLRKKLMEVDQLYPYDLYVPIGPTDEMHFDFEKAKALVLESVKPLGKEYQAVLAKGLGEERWADIYENKKKRSGAYSSGSYDTYPYMLLNFNGSLRDVFTLAHEAGHSMHSYLSHQNQPFVDAQYPIFVAEVASTFNEQLLFNQLIENAKTKKEKAYLINYAIDGIRATLFRQTLFAEFELKIHDAAEKNIPLTPKFLSDLYQELNREYYGEDLALDEYSAIEWARIPHFYYNFYVYQYATGISAAIHLSKIALENKENMQRYLEFLSSGGSKFPLELLQIAGVDMSSPEPVEAAIKRFDELVDELEELLKDPQDADQVVD